MCFIYNDMYKTTMKQIAQFNVNGTPHYFLDSAKTQIPCDTFLWKIIST